MIKAKNAQFLLLWKEKKRFVPGIRIHENKLLSLFKY